MTSVRNETSEIPDFLEIPEQNLRLLNESKPYYHKYKDLYVIIAREINIRNGMNMGDLRVGIIRLEKDGNFELVLPFSKNLICARIKEEAVELTYVENKCLKTTMILFNNEGKLNIEDYDFLLDSEDLSILSTSQVSR